MLDFSKQKKKIFVVKLVTGTTLNIPLPKKRIFEKMAALDGTDADTTSVEGINNIYVLIAEILSSNLQKKKYSAEEVGEMFDLEDVNMLLNEYMTFAGCIANDPN